LVERYGTDLKADILIAPHHGSNTSSSAPFLAKVQPDWVLIPLGYHNRFGFPHPDVLRRYHAYGVQVLDTANAGAISVELGSFAPKSYRDTHGRYWNDPPAQK
jgi:competence protein ComEC